MAKMYKIKCETGNFKVTVNPVTIKVESNYFLVSRRKECEIFLNKNNPTESEILEFLLALHFVLEIGINAFFRGYYKTSSNYDLSQDSKDIDSVDFINKIILFINCNKFILIDKKDVEMAHDLAKKLPGKIKNFNNIRNMIVHGHSVSEISGAIIKKSPLKSKLNKNSYKKQIDDFKEILTGINYFIDRLDTHIPKNQLEVFKNTFLDISFLN